jgi:hypothetical protein
MGGGVRGACRCQFLVNPGGGFAGYGLVFEPSIRRSAPAAPLPAVAPVKSGSGTAGVVRREGQRS